MRGSNSKRGFALPVVLMLLGALVLVVHAVITLERIGAELASTGKQSAIARQNALLALGIAQGELQAAAGMDAALTGMAGMAGVPPGAGNPTRHWCGVWTADGGFVRWLTSGADGPAPRLPAGTAPVVLVGAGSVGPDGTDREHVAAGRIAIPAAVIDEQAGPAGGMAWWVGDDGVKLSAAIPASDSRVRGAVHAIDELVPALAPGAPALRRVTAYGQLAFIPDVAVAPGALQSAHHSLAVSHIAVSRGPHGAAGSAGAMNVNSASARFWRGVAATHDRSAPADRRLGIPASTFGARMGGGISAAASTGKAPGGPFTTVDAFLGSRLVEDVLAGSGVSAADFAEAMAPWFTVRSDTFRVRAYGDAAGGPGARRIEATAVCEAVVQRTTEPIPGHGRRLRLVHFRWLGPGDI